MKLRFSLISCALMLSLTGGALAYGSVANDSEDGWRGTVNSDSATVYSAMSARSAVVRLLKKGDVVKINLEIDGADGGWCSISEIGANANLGYVQAAYLHREQPLSIANWHYQPPPPEIPPDAKDALNAGKLSVLAALKKDQVREEVEKFFASRFGRSLPISAFGQTSLHARMGFDHRNAFDVAVHPDSREGSALIRFLRTQGLPFIAFREAVRGAATGPHIHVGRPSAVFGPKRSRSR